MLPVSTMVAGDILSNTKGKFFSVVFTKRSDGTTRKMLCRTGVKKYTNGEGLKYSPNLHGLIPVYSILDKEYRSIPINGIQRFTAHGVEFVCPSNI